MNADYEALDDVSAPVTLAGLPLPVTLPIGSAIFVVLGEVWITQEGLYDDVVLGPKGRFDVRRRGTILLTRTRGPASVYLASAHRHPATGLDLHQWLVRCAIDMRKQEGNRLFGLALRWFRRLADGVFRVSIERRLRGSTASCHDPK